MGVLYGLIVVCAEDVRDKKRGKREQPKRNYTAVTARLRRRRNDRRGVINNNNNDNILRSLGIGVTISLKNTCSCGNTRNVITIFGRRDFILMKLYNMILLLSLRN